MYAMTGHIRWFPRRSPTFIGHSRTKSIAVKAKSSGPVENAFVSVSRVRFFPAKPGLKHARGGFDKNMNA
jgi:hypothetical protein